MDEQQKYSITEDISVLLNLKLTDIHEENEDMSLTFSADDGTGCILLMDTFFRITDCDRVLVTEMDLFLRDGWDEDPDAVVWNEPGVRAFDQWLSGGASELLGQSVVSVELSAYGDLIIRFSEGVTLTLYPYCTDDGEYWRIIPANAVK